MAANPTWEAGSRSAGSRKTDTKLRPVMIDWIYPRDWQSHHGTVWRREARLHVFLSCKVDRPDVRFVGPRSRSERVGGAQNLATPGYANNSDRHFNYRRPDGGRQDVSDSTIDPLLIHCTNYCHRMKWDVTGRLLCICGYKVLRPSLTWIL